MARRKQIKVTRPSGEQITLPAVPCKRKSLVPKQRSHHPTTFPGPISEVSKHILGGKKTFMEMARLAPELEPQLKRVVDEWDRLPPVGRKYKSIDQLCQIKGVDPIHFIAVVGEAAMRFRDNAQILIAALSAPAVVERLAKEAVKPDKVEDRRMFLQHTGFLPTPRGVEVRMSQIAQQVNTDVDGDFPRVEDTIFETDEIARRPLTQTEMDEIARKRVELDKEPTKQTRQHDPASQPNGNEPASN